MIPDASETPPGLSLICRLHIDTSGGGFMVGATPRGMRAIGLAGPAGHVDGPHIRGRLIQGGGDWGLTGSDGCIAIDFRGMIETDDGVGLYVTQQGRLFVEGDPQAIRDKSRWATLQPSEYYFRTGVVFEAPIASRYDWLNRVMSVGVGSFAGTAIVYRIYQIL